MARKKNDSEISASLVKLKKAGIYTGDIRKDKKSLKDNRTRKSVLSKLRKFANELFLIEESEKTNAKLARIKDKKALIALKSRGYSVSQKSGLVVIPAKKGESISIGYKTGNITYKRDVKDRKTGKIKTEVIFEPNIDLSNATTLEDAVKKYAAIYKQKEGDKIAFTYYGNISKETYSDIEQAMLKVISYEQKQNEINISLSPADIPELMKAVQIVSYIGRDEQYGLNKTLIKDKKAKFNTYFKKLSKNKGA